MSPRPHGQIRQSQIVTTFGPGAMVDLPDHAVIVAGLEHWSGYQNHPITEDRLAAKVANLLGQRYDFYAPPAAIDDPAAPPTGITAWLFPEWFVAQHEVRDPKTGVRSRPLVHRLDLRRGQTFQLDQHTSPVKALPIRFVQACTRGHVSDIDWRAFVHLAGSDCTQGLWLDERGTTGDLTDITIRCGCGQAKALSVAARMDGDPPALGFCKGRRPWLGNNSHEACGGGSGKAQINRLLIRSASNAYFTQTLSAISIPDAGSALREKVEQLWVKYLQVVTTLDQLVVFRQMPEVKLELEGYADADVWAVIQERRLGAGTPTKGIREAEVEMLLQSPDSASNDVPDGWFFARTVPIPESEPTLTKDLTRIVKVHRLREVIVQVGFTRFESSGPDVNGELALDVERAALSISQTWLPATENRGEGVFLGFDADAIRTWSKRDGVRHRQTQLAAGFETWKKNKSGAADMDYLGVAYVMLHTLSHLLITAVSLECGYAASSIRERIYAGDAGYGILLYTASPDAEGTLGGLVEAADRMDRYLRQAIDLGRLCSNDPVCAQHQPQNQEEDRLLSGAACHGCVLLAESSCERRNDFLDRALVVRTVDGDDAHFFDVD